MSYEAHVSGLSIDKQGFCHEAGAVYCKLYHEAEPRDMTLYCTKRICRVRYT